MSKCKKALWTILLSLVMSLALCFGIIFSTRDDVKATVSAETSFTATNTSVTKIQLRNTNRLLFFLNTHDYTGVPATTEITKANAASYNTLNNVLVYTESGEYTLSDIVNSDPYYYNVWGETGSVSYDLSNGFNNTNVTKVVIPAGTEFPSYEYTNNGGEATAYVTTEDTVFINNNIGTSATDSIDWSRWTFTEVSATMYGYNNSRLGVQLSQSDYATANQNFEISAISDLNTMTNITYNGNALESYFVEDNGTDDCYLYMWTHPNTFYFVMAAPTVGDTIVIPAGTQFPSSAFIASGTLSGYVTKYNVAYKYDGSSWVMDYDSIDFTETETSVTSIINYTNGHLGFKLSTHDYANAVNNSTALASSKAAAESCGLNTFTNITITAGDTTSSLLDLYTTTSGGDKNTYLQMFTQQALWVPIAEPESGAIVKIPAGTQFPTNEFVADNTATSCYVTKYNVAYKYDGSSWVMDYDSIDFKETEVSVSIYDYANNSLGLQLSESDYATPNQAFKPVVIAALNTLSSITYNNVALKDCLGTANDGQMLLQMWGHANTIYFPMATPNAGDKIIIPAGTQFPSSAFIKDGTATSCFITTEDVAYKFDGTTWSQVEVEEEPTIEETSVTSIINYTNGHLGFKLSAHDYANAVNNSTALASSKAAAESCGLNTFTNITITAGDTTSSLLDLYTTTPKVDQNTYLQMFTQQALWVPIAEPESGAIVKIPEGTQFPSSAYVNGTSELVYVTTETVAYKFDGSAWAETIVFEETEVSVTMYGYNNSRLGIQLSQSDYDTPNQGFEYSEISALNTLSKITYNGVALSECAPAKDGDVDCHLQMWTHPNTFYFHMAEPVSGDTIVIPAGTQFPSSAYIANGTKTCFVTIENVTFVNVDGNWEQVYTVTFMVDGEVYALYEYTVSNNDIDVPALPAKDGYIGAWESYTLNGGDKVVNAVYTEIPTFEETDTEVGTGENRYIHIRNTNRLLIFLTENDYSSCSTTPVGEKYQQYNTLDQIKLYTSEKKYLTLREVLDTSSGDKLYYNVWTEPNCISYPLKSGYNGLSFVKVEIPAGTQFPSYAYTNDGGALIAYTTTETITLKNGSTDAETATTWNKVLSFEEIETEVTPLLGDRNLLYYEENNNRTGLYIQVAGNDYGTVGLTGAISAIREMNTLSYIEIDGTPLSEFNVSEAYINLYSEYGCIGFLIPGKVTAQQVSIKAGCQIPSLAYVTEGELNCFVVSTDTVFIADKDSWITTSAINWVEVGELLPEMPNMGSSIFIGYEIGGQLYKAGTTATVSGKVKAVYVSYALFDGASIRIGSDIASSGIRFTATLEESSYVAAKAYVYGIGLCVLPEDTIGSAGFNADHTAAPADFRLFSELAGKAPYIFDMYGNLTVRATISTVKLTNYNRSYVARTYVVVQYADGSQEYVYGDYNESNARTIYYVASEAYKDTSANYTAAQREILKEYTSTVADLVFNEETGIVSKNENVVDTPITSFVFESLAANVATVKITVDGEKPLLLLNGLPIRGNRIVEESFADNLYTVSFIVEGDSALCYYASDEELAQFYNEYYALYSAAGDNAVTHSQTGAVVTYQADWGTEAIAWMNATKLKALNSNGSVSYYDADKNIEFYLNNIDVDKHGNVYSDFNDTHPHTANNAPDYSTVTPSYYMNGQGWPFPDYETAGFESFHAEFISKATITDSALLAEYNSWNASGAYESTYLEDSGWTVSGANTTSQQINGVLRYTGGANSDGRIVFDAKDASYSSVFKWRGIYYAAENAPIIELRFLTDTPAAIKDFGIQWRVMSGTGNTATLQDTVYTVWQSDYASNPYDCAANESGMFRSYFPMYTHANYKNQQIGDIRLVVQLADSYNGSPVTIELDYVRGMGDSRQSTNGAKYVIALNEYASYHNDISLLENNLERARKAMLFMLEPLQGGNGLLNNSYLHRHDSYYGVPNGFWDIYPSGNLNAEANTYFYEALLAMAEMEEVAAANGISAAASIEWHGLDGVEKTANWSYTAAELRNLAETVKANINSTFYNEETGRYAWSVRDKASSDGKAAGTLMDYGFTELNLHIVAAGIADEDKALSVMQWINGDRSVSGDKVMGAAIYQRVFAPVSTTVEHTANSDYIEMYTDKAFAYWCQDGGTIMHVSYYDIMARARVLGVENANARLSAIAGWFASVSDYYAANDGSGNYADFFKDYYAANGGNSLQGADGSGELGLQDEFKEASMLYATAPKTYLGLTANYGVLHVTPNLGNLEYFAMKGLSFGGITYSCYATENTVVLSDISGEEGSLLKATFTLAYSEGQNVYCNGKLLSESAYSVVNGYVIITCDFTNVCVQVR